MNGIDGVDHINIYSKGETHLGKWLSNFAVSPIVVDGIECRSIEGYWYYLKTGVKECCNYSGFKAKQFGKQYPAIADTKTKEFQEKILKAIDIKLKNPKMLCLFAQSTLPFTHYYQYGSKKIDAGCEWIIQHLEERRALLKATDGWWNKH
jgi:hypothetical protein